MALTRDKEARGPRFGCPLYLYEGGIIPLFRGFVIVGCDASVATLGQPPSAGDTDGSACGFSNVGSGVCRPGRVFLGRIASVRHSRVLMMLLNPIQVIKYRLTSKIGGNGKYARGPLF